jgi:hypothetical protein
LTFGFTTRFFIIGDLADVQRVLVGLNIRGEKHSNEK